MYKARKYRIYPTNSQKELIHKHCGSVRFIYNLALEAKTMAYVGSKVNLSRYDLQKQMVDLKKELPWLKECNSQSLQVALLNLDTAYKSFFKGGGFPAFKKKSNRGSFNVPQNVIVSDNQLIIPKFKEGIKIKLHRDIVGTIKQCTVSFTPTGKYFVSTLCDTGKEKPSKPKITEANSVGIDLGIKDFAVTSEGEVIQNNRFLKNNIERLKVLQRRASKKKKGSSNRKKANKRVALLHEKINNQRQDFLHKTSSRLVSENQTICFENLGVSNMIKNHCFAQAISDVSWSEFNRMIEYKAEWYGVNILRIGRFAPSSKTCECGVINKDLKLSDRVWECKSCNRVNQRDLLAANNIKKFALNNISGQELPVEPVEMSALVESVKQEAQPIALAWVGSSLHDKNKMIQTYHTGGENSAERTGIENRGIIRPTPNWLLITIDREIDRAQVQGITIDTSWEKEKHAIVTGEVVALSKLKYIQPEYGKSDTLINGESPLEYDTDMEVQLGDNVYFNYLSMNKAISTGRVIEYKGKMCAFIRYDRLYAIERNGIFLGANGYILATRQQAVKSSLLEIPNQRNKNEATVDVVGTPLREYFWEKMQSDNPYYDHGFVQPNDKIVFRETSARQLENKVVRVRDIEYVRLQEKDIFARIRGGVLTPNIGITMVERLANPLSEQLFGTEAFNKTAKGIITASLQFSGEVYYKIGNERTLEIDGQSYTFVIDCYNCTEIKGKQILS